MWENWIRIWPESTKTPCKQFSGEVDHICTWSTACWFTHHTMSIRIPSALWCWADTVSPFTSAHTLTVAAGTNNLATGQWQLDVLCLVLSAGDTKQPSSLMHTETDAQQCSPRSSLHALFDGPRLRPSDVAVFQSVSCSLGAHRLSDIK